MAEQKQFNSNHILKNLEEKYNKASADKKVSSSKNIENYDQNTINNNQNNFAQINPKFNTCIYGKFDMPMYYFGYYNFDGMFLLLYYILFLL